MDTMILLTETLRASWLKIDAPSRVLVAFSGGADSTSLLLSLHALAAQNPEKLQLIAVHVHHGLRERADLDEAFAFRLCHELHIPYHCVKLQLSGRSEEEARTARYHALFTIAQRESAYTIALAHHCQDQAETFLMRLMRGSAEGLGCMRESTVIQKDAASFCLWRPLLQTDPALLRQALKENDIAWTEDESNQDTRYLRNFIRLHLLPTMTQRAAGLDARLCQTASVLQDENDFLNDLASTWLKQNACCLSPCPFILSDPFDQLHAAMKKRVLRLFLKQAGLHETLDFDQTNACCSLRTGQSCNLPAQFRLFRTHSRIHLIFPQPPSSSPASLCASPVPHAPDGIHFQSFPKALLENAVLRTRMQGDYIQPFGFAGKKSIQDYFTDRKIDRPFRDHIPLLCIGNEVIWAIGVGTSESARCSDGAESTLLCYPSRLPMEISDDFKKEFSP